MAVWVWKAVALCGNERGEEFQMEANRRDYMTIGFSKEKEDLEVEVEVQCKIESSIYTVSFALLY